MNRMLALGAFAGAVAMIGWAPPSAAKGITSGKVLSKGDAVLANRAAAPRHEARPLRPAAKRRGGVKAGHRRKPSSRAKWSRENGSVVVGSSVRARGAIQRTRPAVTSRKRPAAARSSHRPHR